MSLQFITRPIADQTTWTELLCVALVGVGVVNDSTTAAGPCAAHWALLITLQFFTIHDYTLLACAGLSPNNFIYFQHQTDEA